MSARSFDEESPIKDPIVIDDEDTNPQMIEKICRAFVVSEATWLVPEDGALAGRFSFAMIFYMTAIRMISAKPFDDDDVQERVMAFLEKKADEAADQLMTGASERIKKILSQS